MKCISTNDFILFQGFSVTVGIEIHFQIFPVGNYGQKGANPCTFAGYWKILFSQEFKGNCFETSGSFCTLAVVMRFWA